MTQREQKLSDILHGVALHLEAALATGKIQRFPYWEANYYREQMADCIAEIQEAIGERESCCHSTPLSN